MTVIKQLIAMLQKILVLITVGITLIGGVLPTAFMSALFFMETTNGKAVIKLYRYNPSLNTDSSLKRRISINTCPYSAMELGPIKCDYILSIRILPLQSIIKI